MTEFMKADIFFFVTTIAVALVSVLLVVGLVYVIRILNTTKKIIEMVKEESHEVIDDIKEFRVKMKAQQGVMKKLPAFFAFIRKITKK